MRVLVNGFAARTGGPETFLLNIMSNIAQLDKTIQYVLLIPVSRKFLYQEMPDNIKLELIRDEVAVSSIRRLFFDHFTIPMRLFRGGFDLYFQADELLSPIIGFSRIPSFIVFHATQHMLIPKVVGDNYLRLLYIRLIKYSSMRLATVPVTVSHHAKGELSGLYPFAYDKIKVIYHGVDFSKFTSDKNVSSLLEMKYGIKDYILSVSNRHVYKNYFNLVKAFHELISDNNICIDLVLIGGVKSNFEENRICDYIRDNKLSKRVHMLEYVNLADIPSVYKYAKAYAFPSTFETFGMTPLEAMACGLPCACSKASCMPEICGDAAIYFKPNNIGSIVDALKQVVNDGKIRDELIEIGYHHVNKFQWKDAASEYLQLFKKSREV